MGPELARTFAAIGAVGFIVFGLIAFGCLKDARRREGESAYAGGKARAAVGCLWFFGILCVLLALIFGGCGVAYLAGSVR